MPTPSWSNILISPDAPLGAMQQHQQHQQQQQAPTASYGAQDGDSVPSRAASQAAAPQADNEMSVVNPRPPPQGLYQCADCKKRYSRPEHLARHIKGHTLGKRFACPVCSKAFARADLLKRHVTNHENDDGRKRRRMSPNTSRVTRACRGCAAARVKCEETKPCSRCTKRKVVCEYTSPEDEAESDLSMPVGSNAALQGGTTASGTPGSIISDISSSPVVEPGVAVRSDAPYPVPPTDSVQQFRYPRPDPQPSASMSHHQGGTGQFMGGMPQGTAETSWLPFTNFLHDVVYDQPTYDMSRFSETQGLTALDFGDNANYEMTDIDYRLLDNWNLDVAHSAPKAVQPDTPHSEDSALEMSHMKHRLVQMWSDPSIRWQPPQDESNEPGGLPLPFGDSERRHLRERQKQITRIIEDKLESSSTNQMLLAVLRATNDESLRMRVASSFPSTDLLDTLIQMFLSSQQHAVDSWLHHGTLKLNDQWAEWLALAASAGATLTPAPALRKFGYALQDSIRKTLQAAFERDHSKIMNLMPVQTMCLLHDIGLWSGNRHRMEMAECHIQIPVTMMRYRGRLRRSTYPPTWATVDPSDEGDDLEQKWREWSQIESWKRLVFHCFIRDAQASITYSVNPAVSYAELDLPLPESRDLWSAPTAAEWKKRVLAKTAHQFAGPLPSISDLIQNPGFLIQVEDRLDVQFAASICIHAYWGLVFSWRQLYTTHHFNVLRNPGATGLARSLNLRHQELCGALNSFHEAIFKMRGGLQPREMVVLHLVQMHLHLSMEDVQLFSGREGVEPARKALPMLQQWIQKSESRQAVWHAGQMLRHAKMVAHGHLRDFISICVLHAALALWTYSVFTKVTLGPDAGSSGTTMQPASAAGIHTTNIPGSMPVSMTSGLGPTAPVNPIVYIDGDGSADVSAFIEMGRGRPAIRGPNPRHRGGGGVHHPHQQAHHHLSHPPAQKSSIEACLDDLEAFMKIPHEILRENHAADEDAVEDPLPPLVQNCCQIMKKLGVGGWMK